MAQTKKNSKRSAQTDMEPHEPQRLKPLSRIAIHPKWEQLLFSKGQAWISVRSEGSTIIGDCFDCKVVSPPDTAAPPCTAVIEGKQSSFACRSGFKIHSVTPKSIELSYDQIPSIASRATFHAATRVYEEVFKRGIVSIDIQESGYHGAAVSIEKEHSGIIKVWRMDNEEVKCTLKDQGDLNAVKWVPSTFSIAYTAEKSLIRIYSVEKMKHVRTLRGHTDRINEIMFADTGKNLFSASVDGTVRLWDITRADPIETVAIHFGVSINCISTQTADRSVYESLKLSGEEWSSGGDGRVLLYGTQEDQHLRIASVDANHKGILFDFVTDAPIQCCAFLQHPYFACGTDTGHLYYFDWRRPDKPLSHWREIRSGILNMFGHKGGIVCGTADGSCFYRNPLAHRDTNMTVEFSGPEEPAKVCQYAGNLVTCSRDGKIREYILP